jgi:RND family efflux transporter MFP subunit
MSRFLALGAALLGGLAAAILLGGCGRRTAAGAADEWPAVAVRTVVVEHRVEPRSLVLPGTVRPLDRAAVGARVTGEVSALPVVLGQLVAAGDLLVELAAPELESRVAAAEAEWARAVHDWQRESGLLAQQVSTTDTVRRLDLERQAAEARLAEARALAGYRRVTAPFAGTIVARLAQVGDLAIPGRALLELERAGPRQVELEVPESLAGALAPGAQLEVTADAGRWTGTLVELSGAADTATRGRRAKLDLPDGIGLNSGAFVRVAVPAGEAASLRVPARAVSMLGQMERVFVVADGRAVLRLVRTGAWLGEDTREILSGLVVGEQVVVAHDAPLRDGQRVEVRR